MNDEFNPNDIRSMIDYVEQESQSSTDTDDVLLKFVENCIFLESQSHHWHLQCHFYSKHMALDELYKDLPEYVDAFIEGMMEERGAIYSTGSSFTFQPLDNAIAILEGFIDQCTSVHKILDDLEEYGSVNTLEDIISFVNGILYKLKVLT